MNQILKCFNCANRFPFNPEKHRHDQFVYCPSCHTAIKNPSKHQWKMPSFNLNWIRRKLDEIQKKREAKKFLDKYFKVSRFNSKTQKTEEFYTFPLNKWMQGQRPRLSQEEVLKALGGRPTMAEIESETRWLEKLNVKIR